MIKGTLTSLWRAAPSPGSLGHPCPRKSALNPYLLKEGAEDHTVVRTTARPRVGPGPLARSQSCRRCFPRTRRREASQNGFCKDRLRGRVARFRSLLTQI